MPVYEYVCDDCGHTTEAIRSMADKDATMVCEHCGSSQTRRALSLFMATSGDRRTAGAATGGGCCRCGDPNGPCAM